MKGVQSKVRFSTTNSRGVDLYCVDENYYMCI